jgi:hypothetical protein
LVLIWPGMVQTIFRDAAFEAIIARELPETPRKSSIRPPSGHHKTGAIIDDPFSGVKFYADAEEVLAKLPAGNNGPSRV